MIGSLFNKRVKLRLLQETDALAIIACLNINPELVANLAFFSNGVPSMAEETAWIKKVTTRPNQEFVFAAETLEKDILIGTAGIHEIDAHNKNARVGIMIANKDFIGKGYAREILETLHGWVFGKIKLSKLFMNFRTDNGKMRRIAEKLGYHEVGILKQEYFWKGQFLDFVRFELTAQDYQKRIQGAQ